LRRLEAFGQITYGAAPNFGLMADKIRASVQYRELSKNDQQLPILLGIFGFKGLRDWI